MDLRSADLEALAAFGRVTVAPWPHGRRFSLFLSHDIDEVYDRELFRLLGDINHLRRVWTRGEPGKTVPCLKRLARAVVRPRRPGADIDTILAVERNAGLRSTFFLLEDPAFNRHGGRYRYSDPAVKTVARAIERAGCEIAVHGAYHAFNDPARHRAQARSFRDAFGRDPAGTRNHFLRHDGPATWRAQRDAGYRYDASFGFNDGCGIRDGRLFPFFAPEDRPQRDSLVVLPLTIMDCAVFRHPRISPGEALEHARGVAAEVRDRRGLLTLSWHNNFFDDEEYAHWQEGYENLLAWLAGSDYWCATGEEIADWWRRRAGVRISTAPNIDTAFQLMSESSLEGLTVHVQPGLAEVPRVRGADAEVRPSDGGFELIFGALKASSEVTVSLVGGTAA